MSETTETLKLDVNRLYDRPNLSGAAIGDIAWRPGGEMLTYLCGGDTANEIRGYDLASGEATLLLDCARVHAVSPDQLEVRALHAGVPIRAEHSQRNHPAGQISYQWFPSGEALVVSVGLHTPQIFHLETDTLTPLTSDPTPVRDVRVAPDGRYVSFVRGWDLYMVDIATGREMPLTVGSSEELRSATPDTMGDLLYDSGHWWSPDGRQIAYLQTDERDVPLFWRADLMSRRGQNAPERFPQPGDPIPAIALKVVNSDGHRWINTHAWPGWYLARVTWLPDSRYLALQMLNRSQNILELVLADSVTGATRSILKETDPAWVNVVDDLRFFSDSRRFIWSSERASYRHLYLYDIDGTELCQLTAGEESCVGVEALDEAGSAVYYLSWPEPYSDARIKRVRFEEDDSGLRSIADEVLTTEPGSHFGHPSPDCRFIADHSSDAITPPRLVLRDGNGQRLAVVEANECRDLSRYNLRPYKFGSLSAARLGIPSDSMPLKTKLLEPEGLEPGRKYPVVVYVYGGPLPGGFGLARNVLNYWRPVPELWMQMMAQRGFGIFSLDNRGSNAAPRGHDWEIPIHKRLGHVELADQLQGVEYLKSLPWVDEDRIGLLGGSFGGFMTLSGMLRPEAADAFSAAVCFAPVTNWRQYDCVYTERYMELPEENPSGYDQTGLPPLAGNLDDPLLMVHGAADPNVHIQHSIELINELIKSSKRFRMMLYPKQVHMSFFGMGQSPARLWTQITDYFEDMLGDQAGPVEKMPQRQSGRGEFNSGGDLSAENREN